LENILAVLALISTIIGITCNTRNEKRITAFGWVIVAVASSIFILTLIQNIHHKQEETQRKKIVYVKILRSIHSMAEPWAFLLADIDLKTGSTILNQEIKNFANVTEEKLASSEITNIYNELPKLLEQQSFFDYYKVNDKISILGKTSPELQQLFLSTFKPGVTDLSSILNIYHSDLDASIIQSIEDLRGDWLVKRIDYLYEAPPESKLVAFLHLRDTMQHTNGNSVFIDFIRKVQNLNMKVCEELETYN
jgi:hypothetical protein